MKKFLVASAVILFTLPANAQSTLYSSSTTGDIGIGTSIPINKLDVYGATAIGTGYAGVNTAPANGLLVQGSVGIGTTNPLQVLEVYGTSNTYSLVASSATNLNAASEYSDGTHFAYTGFLGSSGGGTSGNYVIYNNGSIGVVVTGSNLVGLGTTAPVNRLDISGAAAIGTGYAGVNTAPTNGLLVQGNVGIGTTSAGNPLVVNGIVQSLTGGVRFPDGTTQTTAATTGSDIKSVIVQTFTSSGTYTPSAGMAYAKVQIIGGGGAGGGVSSVTGGGGGQGGSYSEGIFNAATIGASQTITIGSGGSGSSGSAGGSGGTTSVGTILTATGGDGGAAGTSGGGFVMIPVLGGHSTSTGSGGYINVPGTNGGSGFGQAFNNAYYLGGQGGNGFGGGGGGYPVAASSGGAGSGGVAGVSATGYGAGGGGAGAFSGSYAGGGGSSGIVVVTEYCTQ